MSRSVIAKLFYGSLIAFVAAILVIVVAAAILLSSSSLVMDGPDVVGVRSPYGWPVAVFAVFAVLAAFVIIGASVAQFVAWIGMLLESAPLENKTWFVVLLVAGLLGFGLITMLVYLLAAPDPGRVAVPAAPAPVAVSDAG
jgi:hypothetical protein